MRDHGRGGSMELHGLDEDELDGEEAGDDAAEVGLYGYGGAQTDERRGSRLWAPEGSTGAAQAGMHA